MVGAFRIGSAQTFPLKDQKSGVIKQKIKNRDGDAVKHYGNKLEEPRRSTPPCVDEKRWAARLKPKKKK